jgi:NAD(P)-dependent dehydrogenase (short-subunit alcohol dehydrogenase family)/acyl carrier protein
MVRHGAGTIVLVGRHAPSDTTEAELRRLSDGGSKVLFRVCDVEDGEAVDALIADLAASHPPLRGVFHAAGVVDDGVLTEMTWERVWKVMGPKAAGVWALHCATRGLALDSFVLFSSLACLAGWKGQGNYAAANAFLDAFAAWRRTCGLPGLSVNWSAWEDTGMTAAVSEADRQRFARSGLRGMPPDRALASLERLMRSPATNAAVADIDWENFLANGVESALASFWETAKGGRPAGNRPAGEPARAEEPPLRARIEAAPASRRRAILRDYVERVVVRTLGLAPGTPVDPGQGLRGLGLDSLMSVELRNTLQKSLDAVLPSTLAFDHPTVNALVDHLGDTVLGLGEARSAPLQPEAGDHKRLREMTDEEAEAELREELQRKK